MNKTRLEALSDGIFAVVMTLAIFQFKVPAGGNL
ncbi:MAG: TMEM175 family protein, partial [Lactococcus sp.]